MSNVLSLNSDGSFQEIAPVSVSVGPASAGSLIKLNSLGLIDASMTLPQSVNFDGGSALQAPGLVNINLGGA